MCLGFGGLEGVTGLGDEVAGAGGEDDAVGLVVGDLEVVGAVGVFDHVDPLEEGLVDQAADVLGCGAVEGGAVLGEVEGLGDEPVGFGVVRREGVQAAGRGVELGGELLLLGAEHVQGDGVVVVGFQEFALPAADGQLCLVQVLTFGVGVLPQELQARAEQALQGVAELGGEGDALVQIGDQVFDVVDLDGAQGARGALGVPAEAGVVGVGGAVAVGGDLHDHPEPALPAVQGGLQVVVVGDDAFAVEFAVQDGLDGLEGAGVDQGCVLAGVGHAAVGDHAGVEGVGQDPVDGADLHRA
ncbi:MAG TPA: hypothetical protein VGC57_15405 [Cellulomonas sp.]